MWCFLGGKKKLTDKSGTVVNCSNGQFLGISTIVILGGREEWARGNNYQRFTLLVDTFR